MNNEAKSPPPVFTPDNEPYLGRASVFQYDQVIVSCLEASAQVAAYTHEHSEHLTDLQKAACQVIPQGFNLALSIRELVRQGYLFAALVLIRPLIERAAIVSYLDVHPEQVSLWASGWRHRERPSFNEMLQAMSGNVAIDEARIVAETFHHLVHGDPVSADFNLVDLGDRGLGYSVGKVLDEPDLCDFICFQCYCYMLVLRGRMHSLFPNAGPQT